MLKLIKSLKIYLVLVIVVAVLVAIEVKAELELPVCVGGMVSKGLEQSGIENSIPLIIDESQKENICKLVVGEGKNIFLKSYNKLVDKTELNNNKKLKNLKIDLNNKQLYIMCNKNEKELQKLDETLLNALSIIAADSNMQVKKLIIAGTNLSVAKPISEQLFSMGNIEKERVLAAINKNVSKVNSNILIDAVVKEIKDYYKYLGINISDLQKNYIKNAGLKMLGYIFMAEVPWMLIMLISAVVATGVAKKIRIEILKKISSFSNFELDNFSVSSLITRTTNDVANIQNFLLYFLETIFLAPMLGINAFKRVYEKNVQMSLVVVIVLCAMTLITTLILIIVVPKYNLIQKLIDKINLVVRENLTGLLSVRAFNSQKFEEGRFNEVNKKITKINFFVEKVMALIDPLIFLITSIATLVIVWVSYKYVLNYTLQVGDIIIYINYVICVIFSFLIMSMMIVELPRAYVSIKRILKVLKTKPTIVDVEEDAFSNICFTGNLVFNNVSFCYPNAKEGVLNDISFVAEPGKTTAIIGATGSGKSTIANLILRFYDVASGEILLDGVNIKNIPQHKLREQISYAPQKGSLLSGTIESNIKYGNYDASNEEMVEVAEVAQARDFIEQKPNKFLFEVSQGGTNVSGGQRQRLSIARAIMKKSKIYIFDDSFSALDFKTDLALRKSLNRYIKNSTIIIIAQRIGTILHADQIIVLDEGKIVGKGTHKELLKNCKKYYEIASIQLPPELL